MEFNKLVFAGLAVGCLAAAAGGSYLAVRQNQIAVSACECNECTRSRPRHPLHPVHPRRVTESEGVISPEPAKPARPDVASHRLRRCVELRPCPARRRARRVLRLRRRVPSIRAQPLAITGSRITGGIERTGAVCGVQQSGTMWETRPSVQPSTPEYKEPEPPAPPPPPAPEFVDLTVPSDAVLGLQIERTVSSELARVEDKVEARVTRDVRVSDRIAIPAGSTVRGSVTEVDRGGRMKGKARLAIRFHTIVLADGTQVALKTDPVVREGQSPGGESAAKVGGAAIGGAILGAILGGGKGAAIGGAVGAGAGTAAAMTNDRSPATLTAGTTVTVRMQAPVTVTVQKRIGQGLQGYGLTGYGSS